MLSGYNPEPVREQDSQLLGRLPPVLHRLGPLLPDSRKCKIYNFSSAISDVNTSCSWLPCGAGVDSHPRYFARLPMAYRSMILSASESARIFSRLRTTWGLKVPSRSRGVLMATSPIEVCTCLLMWPWRRLLNSRSPPSKWLSIPPSRALLSRFSNSGTNTPSLPERGTPAFNCSWHSI